MIRIGIIGLSEGNGHPYSWSAIFNGFDETYMRECPFPVIPEYLSKQKFPDDAIPGAQVTHIWTQDAALSKQVAQAAKIENIVTDMKDMIGKVDAVLLARDDAENHFEMARPFLEAGLPIFIDKPIAYSVSEARKIFALEKYSGQIFTCSSLRFSKDLTLTVQQKNKIGEIRQVIGSVPKDWKKYSIHAIEPALGNLKDLGAIEHFERTVTESKTTLEVQWQSGVQGTFTNFDSTPSPIQLKFIGTNGTETLTFKNTYQAFKSSLEAFMISVKEKKRIIPVEQTLSVIELLEKGT